MGREPRARGGRGEAGTRHGEEGPEEDEAVEVDFAAHGGEAEDAGAALEAHQEGLGLVVEAVRGQEMGRAGLPCGGDEQPVPGIAGGGLDVAARLRPRQVRTRACKASASRDRGDAAQRQRRTQG